MRPVTTSVTASGATKHVIPFPQSVEYVGAGLLATVSPGADLTYNVEVTGDNIGRPGYDADTGNWNVFDDMGALTASANGTLIGAVMGFRLNVTSWTSGSVTLSIVTLR
jgi:hypothetical protein